jgi:hypothetical protein
MIMMSLGCNFEVAESVAMDEGRRADPVKEGAWPPSYPFVHRYHKNIRQQRRKR